MIRCTTTPASTISKTREALEFIDNLVQKEAQEQLERFIKDTLVPNARLRYADLLRALAYRVEESALPGSRDVHLDVVFMVPEPKQAPKMEPGEAT